MSLIQVLSLFTCHFKGKDCFLIPVISTVLTQGTFGVFNICFFQVKYRISYAGWKMYITIFKLFFNGLKPLKILLAT